MTKDLDHFSGKKLKGTLVGFHNSLPKTKLRKIFVDSMGGCTVIDKDITNVLQAYRGPETPNEDDFVTDSEYLGPNDGLQEVQFKWGVSKHLNWLPIAGQVSFLFGRLTGDTKWHKIYFDSTTGKCLSHDKEKAAEKLNARGVELQNEGKLEEAYQYFSNAYKHSANEKNWKKFFINQNNASVEIEAMKINADGDKLFIEEKYDEALHKYQAAYVKSQDSCQRNKYLVNRNNAEIELSELSAMNTNSVGNRLFYEGKYDEARLKYQAAYEKSRIESKYKIYDFNMTRATAEIKAKSLSSEGDIFFEEGRYVEAFSKYQAAFDYSDVRTHRDSYLAKMDKAEIIISQIKQAERLNEEGDELLKQGYFERAFEKYELAYNTCPNNISKKAKFQRNKNIAKNNSSNYLKQQGDKLYEQKKYTAAAIKYHKAVTTCTIDRKDLKKINIVNAANCYRMEGRYSIAIKQFEYALEMDYDYEYAKNSKAETLNEWGNKLLQQGRFSEAVQKYTYSLKECARNYKFKQTFVNNINQAKAEILNEEGENLCEKQKYQESVLKFLAAYEQVSENCGEKLKNKIRNNEAKALNQQGLKLYRNGEYSMSLNKFKLAMQKCTKDCKEKQQFITNKDRTQAEIEAITLNSEGNELFKTGKYIDALTKYQEALNKSCFNKTLYQKAITKMNKYIDVINQFQIIINNNDIKSTDLKSFGQKLENMIEEEYKSDPEIVHRSHIISLRLARMEMNTELESIQSSNKSDIISAIMNLIETELLVLKSLNISDKQLELKLQSLEDNLKQYHEKDTSNEDQIINIRSIATRAEEALKEVEIKAIEKLAYTFQSQC